MLLSGNLLPPVQSIRFTTNASGSGGGIGGLITAVALAKYDDLDVIIYESAKQLGELGAGIGVWPRTFAFDTQYSKTH